jgi:hypothetical protein
MDRESPGMDDSSLPDDPIQWLKEWLAEAEHIDLPNPGGPGRPAVGTHGAAEGSG